VSAISREGATFGAGLGCTKSSMTVFAFCRRYLGDEGNTTPYFFIPVSVVGGCAYFLLPLSLFVVTVIASAASFYAHVFFDKEYHVEGSRLQRFAWFRRKQELHFVHHRHANSNFGVIHFFWDKILGTYRRPDFGA
jgi:sterol desaturase/sphingolipid hydroxylase (fatty acid hydroxylase superfamily)